MKGHSVFRVLVWWLALGCTGLMACSTITSEEPPISDSTMTELMVELHLADARVELQLDVPDTLRSAILYKYGLDEQGFRQIIAYYADHPEAYASLATTVLDRISAERYEQFDTPLDSTSYPTSSTP